MLPALFELTSLRAQNWKTPVPYCCSVCTMLDSAVCIYCYAYCLSNTGLYADRAHDDHFLHDISSTVRKSSEEKKSSKRTK